MIKLLVVGKNVGKRKTQSPDYQSSAFSFCGEGGIRTPGTLSRTHV